MLRISAWILLLGLTGCAGCEATPVGDAGLDGGLPGDPDAMGVDARIADRGAADRAREDVRGEDATADRCGDQVVGPEELCDGPQVTCASLSPSYSGGWASCRDDCQGYDLSACTRQPQRLWEVIKPAQRDARWQLARCNDGTPFDLLYKPGAADVHTWVIYLQGGGFGDDQAFATIERGPELTATLELADRVRGPFDAIEHGLFGGPTINPDFHDAHMVFAHYCSSDLWSGRGSARRPVEGSATGYYFAGRHNIRALIEILRQRHALDDSEPELRVLYGGASAGCIGATQTADIVAAQLPITAAAGRLRILADGAYLVPMPAEETDLYWGDASVDDITLLDQAIVYWDALPLPTCPSGRRGECYYGRGFYPGLTEGLGLPVLVAMSVMDEVILGLRGACFEGCGPGGPACFPGCTLLDSARYASFRQRHRDDFTATGVSWLFAWGSHEHTAALVDNRFNGPPGAAEPLRQLLGEFFFDRGPARQVYVNGADQ